MEIVPEFCREDERLKTFERWPREYTDKRLMAMTGFVYVGRGMQVLCVFCHALIESWHPDADIVRLHKGSLKACPLLEGKPTKNVAIDEAALQQALAPLSSVPRAQSVLMSLCVDPTKYGTVQARFESFRWWPKQTRPCPVELADMGFFYTNSADKIVCHMCGIALFNVNASAKAVWLEHARKSLFKCGYVLQRKGERFMREAEMQQLRLNALKRQAIINKRMSNDAREELQASAGDDVVDESAASRRSTLLCTGCSERLINMLFLPCRHLTICHICAQRYETCPMCQTKILNRHLVHTT